MSFDTIKVNAKSTCIPRKSLRGSKRPLLPFFFFSFFASPPLLLSYPGLPIFPKLLYMKKHVRGNFK